MCGLTALVEPGRHFAADLLSDMSRDLHHRGPDSGGVMSEPGVALVFRRLAILDPTPGSDQPMTDPSGRFTLVFNGEIYNYRVVRAALEQEGVPLRTDGDSEAILMGWAQWGAGVLERLEGMYAFALLDRKAKRLYAARDPFGIKPLYLTRRGNFVGLASEMRPLLRLVPAEPDPAAIAEHLTFTWAAGRLSNLKGIDRVPGGTLVTVDLTKSDVAETRFCDPLDTLKPDPRMTANEAREQAATAVAASVRAHLASDVGYTVQLSGGVDSSLITALAAPATRGRLKTFGIKLEDARHDEGPYRALVVERTGVDHHEVAMSSRDFGDALPRAVRHLEGPSPHLGCVLLMRLCDEIRKHSKVVLTGEGGDEMFGGYFRYGVWRKLAWQERLSRVLPAPFLPARPPFLGIKRMAGRDAAAYASINHNFLAMHRTFPELVPAPGAREAASRRFRDFRERLHAVDQTNYLESLLLRQDKMAMAASVEARVPFVHLPLARVVNRIPAHIRTPGGETKPLLKRIAEPYLPQEVLYRRKVGLTLPVHDWLRDADGLGRYLDDLTAPDSRLASFADRRRIANVVEGFRKGGGDGLPDVMRLVNVECWLRSLPADTAKAEAA
jgi:asparagine synthase (glutamine-hydrolysing)